MPGTRNGPHEILVASPPWSSGTGRRKATSTASASPSPDGVSVRGDGRCRAQIRRVTAALLSHASSIILGGEHSITPRWSARSRKISRRVGAANRRARRSATRSGRRTAACDAAQCSSSRGRRRHSQPVDRRSGRGIDADRDLHDSLHAEQWTDRSRHRPLSEQVYITIDVDGFDPAIMPATGTPEPGGLSCTRADAAATRD